ncbi:MAG: LysM peptidoglycan-binding domain-containing protein [Chthoniobacterales bacterium]|jgi:LysM repeat protein
MKIPLFSKLTAKSRGRKVVRASAARAARGHADDYYEMEPNMKLSHAFMVVLILHIVAVGGIFAFNHINARKSTGPNLLSNLSDRIAQATGAGASTAAAKAPVVPAAPAAPVRQPGDADDPLPLVTSDSATAGTLVQTAPAAPAPVAKKEPAPAVAAKAPAASGPVPDTYKVEKGDNPYNIAKKFGVNYKELLTLNGVDDPTKLQIGQELKIPKKTN